MLKDEYVEFLNRAIDPNHKNELIRGIIEAENMLIGTNGHRIHVVRTPHKPKANPPSDVMRILAVCRGELKYSTTERSLWLDLGGKEEYFPTGATIDQAYAKDIEGLFPDQWVRSVTSDPLEPVRFMSGYMEAYLMPIRVRKG